MTRSSSNWKSRPGNFDTLNARLLFPSSDNIGIPDLMPQDFDLPDKIQLLPYGNRSRTLAQERSIVHFYLDDYRFETVWTRVNRGLGHIRRHWGTLGPDFSLYRDWPPILQMWNTYRARWVCRFWQENDVRVIPTVNWSTEDNYAWCFTGLPAGQIISIGVPDQRDQETAKLFESGYWEMIRRIDPRIVLVYGKLPFESQVAVELPPDWMRLRRLNDKQKELNFE